jgi:hypothetical protein
VTPKAPDAKNPNTPKPITRAVGTKTGLKITKTGVVTASPMSVPTRVRPERKRRVPPTDNKVTTAKTWEVEGPFPGRVLAKPWPPGLC